MSTNINFYTKDENGFFSRHAQFADEDYYFKVKSKYRSEITESADPFVILLIFRMMRQGGQFHIQGEVSKSLLNSLELFASYWNVLLPDTYKKIKINAEYEINDEPKKLENKAIACFSGGVDASFSLYRHRKGLAGRNNKNIDRALLIHGADIKLSDKERFKEAFSSCEKMCTDLGVHLVSAEMNYRSFMHNWETEHIAVLAAALRFWKNYPYQMIASSYPVYDFKMPWSSNPVTDHILSSNLYKFINDALHLSRTEKVAVLKNWKEGIKNIRVCWEKPGKTINCGTCEKCMRTYLNFRAVGIKELESMAENFDTKNLQNLQFDNDREFYMDLINYTDKHNIKDPVFIWLKKKMKKTKLKKVFEILTKLRYKILSKIMFGKRKKHYMDKFLKIERKTTKIELYTFK